MAWPKGKPRPIGAGRKAGTPNKRRSILEICEELSFDPFIELAKIAADNANLNQFAALKELCQYIEPKKKSTEVALDPEKSTIRIIVEDYSKK
jgi:hypothetical protein